MHSMLEIRVSGSNDLCLIPFIPAIVLSVNMEKKSMILDPPAGLLDLTYQEIKKVIIRGFLPAEAIGLTEEERRELTYSS